MRSMWTIPVCLALCLLAPRTGGAAESKVVERSAYAEHGEALDAETGAPVVCGATCGTRVGTVVGYRGMRRLGLGDTYDARYRIYDAQLRLFWSKDPLGWVDGYDRWAYVGGELVNLWDPWGLAAAATRRNPAYVMVDPDLSEAQLRQRAVLEVLSDLPRPWDRVHDLIWTDESEARDQQSIALDARVEPTNALVGDMVNHVVEGTPAASGMLWELMVSGANPARTRPSTVAPMSAAPSGGSAAGPAARAIDDAAGGRVGPRPASSTTSRSRPTEELLAAALSTLDRRCRRSSPDSSLRGTSSRIDHYRAGRHQNFPFNRRDTTRSSCIPRPGSPVWAQSESFAGKAANSTTRRTTTSPSSRSIETAMARFHFDESSLPPSPKFVANVRAGVRDPHVLLEELAAQLRFPDYFGANWNALEECVRDLSWLPDGPLVLKHHDLPLAGDVASQKTYLSILSDVVEKKWTVPGQRLRDLFVLFPPETRQPIDCLVRSNERDGAGE